MTRWIDTGQTACDRPPRHAAQGRAIRKALAADFRAVPDRLLADLGVTRAGTLIPEERPRPDSRSRRPGPGRWSGPGISLSAVLDRAAIENGAASLFWRDLLH